MTSRRRFLKRGLALAGVAAVAGIAGLLPRRANAYYSGPVSDHFDGQRFFNPGGRSPKGLADVARLYWLEAWEPWPDAIPSPNLPDKPPPAVAGAAARLVLIGHASWLLQTGGRNVLIDPVWTEQAGPNRLIGPRRSNPPAIALDDLPPIHAVLVTHNHYDHMDLDVLARLWQRHRPLIVMPLGNDTILRSVVPDATAKALDWGDAAALGGGLVAHCVPSQHWSARGARDRHHALWASFVISTPAGKIYAVGDSGLGDGRTFRAVGAAHPGIRLALLPIGAFEPRWFMESQHMNPEDAVEALLLCGAEAAIGHHWGTFRLTTEAHDRPPADLAAALARRALGPARFRPARPGDVIAI